MPFLSFAFTSHFTLFSRDLSFCKLRVQSRFFFSIFVVCFCFIFESTKNDKQFTFATVFFTFLYRIPTFFVSHRNNLNMKNSKAFSYNVYGKYFCSLHCYVLWGLRASCAELGAK